MHQSQPTLARRTLGRALKRHRESNGLNRSQAAKTIRVSPQTIQRMEDGITETKYITVKGVCDEYGISDAEKSHLCELAVAGAQRGWWESNRNGGPPGSPLFLETEQVADLIQSLETELIPGLLQVPEYLNAIQEAFLSMPEAASRSARQLRAQRQQMLFNRKPLPTMQFLIGRGPIESLRYLPEFAQLKQKEHLLKLSSNSSIEIKVLPHFHPAMTNSFNILKSESQDEKESIVYLESLDGCRYIEDSEVNLRYQQAFEQAWANSSDLEEHCT